MGKKIILDSTLTAIANAIRGKTGSSATMTPLQMPAQINSIIDKLAGILLTRDETSYSNATFDGKIPAYAFYAESNPTQVPNTSLQSVSMPNATQIRDNAFYGQGALETVNFASATSVQDHAFHGCAALATVDFSNLTNVGNYGFTNAFAANSVITLPELTSAAKDAFSATKLAQLIIPKFTGTIPQNFLSGSSIQTITFKNAITYILGSAFYNCQSLTSIIFEDDITDSIAAQAFARCSACTLIDMRNCTSVPSLENTNAFDRINANVQIVVPDDLYNTWIAATNWATHASKIVKASDYTA